MNLLQHTSTHTNVVLTGKMDEDRVDVDVEGGRVMLLLYWFIRLTGVYAIAHFKIARIEEEVILLYIASF